MEIGFALSSEDHPPNELVRQAEIAEQAGFTYALISDHFHPWMGEQGHSPFVWSTLGGIAQATQTIRVGTGENLNEHMTGAGWPLPGERLEMLEEAVEVIRKLWSGGDVTTAGSTTRSRRHASTPPRTSRRRSTWRRRSRRRASSPAASATA